MGSLTSKAPAGRLSMVAAMVASSELPTQAGRPTLTVWPLMIPVAPWPGSAWKLVTVRGVLLA